MKYEIKAVREPHPRVRSTKKGAKKGGPWMVVISNDRGVLVGCPLRGVSEAKAKGRMDSLRFAFVYGLGAAHEEHWNLTSTVEASGDE